MHQDGDQGFELEYNVCGVLSMAVCDVEKFLSCCSPSISNPRPHIVLLTSLGIVFKTDSEISFIVSGKVVNNIVRATKPCSSFAVSSIDDFSRVKLREIPGEEGSDYINASFLDVNYKQIM